MNPVSSRPPVDGGLEGRPGAADAFARGQEEVRACRKDPACRATSALGDLTAGPGWLAALRLTAIRFPGITRAMLAACCAIASLMAKLTGSGGLAARATASRDAFQFCCGAIAESGGWNAFRREFAMRLPVLCYHHVGEALPNSWPLLTVSPEVFRRQIEWLSSNGYAGIHAADWLAWLRKGTVLPEKPVLVTFDDGYSDLIEHAIPVLENASCKATIFIVSQHIGAASTWDVPLGHPSRPLMNAEQVQECPSHGIEIGAHSRVHPDLRTLPDAALKAELEGCRADLTELMSRPVNTLAYCFGFQNELVRKRSSEIYDLSFAAKPGLNAWRTDTACLRRMFVHSSRINFALQVKYGIDLHAVYRFTLDRSTRVFRKVFPAPAQSARLSGKAAGAAQVTDVNR